MESFSFSKAIVERTIIEKDICNAYKCLSIQYKQGNLLIKK